MCKLRAIFFAAALTSVSGGVFLAVAPARAENCPANPNALGTSRTLIVAPAEYPRIGTMQYPDSLPLADKEVVITFDDGPLPPYSNQVLDILTSQCVKATFFIVGEMAHYFPQVVRREFEAGYTIGSHSWDHPIRFERLTGDKLRHQIDDGVAAVSAALGDSDDLAPFFRIPGLGRSPEIEQALADRSLVVFSADVVADDWHRRITPDQIIERAISRLEKRGKGILLLHDIHKATVAALPGLLKELKNHGFHVVQVVGPSPATMIAKNPPTTSTLASAMPEPIIFDDGASAPTWPDADVSLTHDDVALSAPDVTAFATDYPPEPDGDVAGDTDGRAPWPELSQLALPSSGPELPAPGLQAIGVSMKGRQLVGNELVPRPSADDPATSSDHGELRHDPRHVHHRVRSPGEGQHAELLRSTASPFTTVR